MSDTMYYEKPVLLDRDKHRKRRVRQSNSFAFAKKANSLFVAGVEFNEASKEYAIVFTRVGNGKVVPGRTGATYKLGKADRGRRIQVRVTVHRGGYADRSATSGAVKVRR